MGSCFLCLFKGSTYIFFWKELVFFAFLTILHNDLNIWAKCKFPQEPAKTSNLRCFYFALRFCHVKVCLAYFCIILQTPCQIFLPNFTSVAALWTFLGLISQPWFWFVSVMLLSASLTFWFGGTTAHNIISLTDPFTVWRSIKIFQILVYQPMANCGGVWMPLGQYCEGVLLIPA